MLKNQNTCGKCDMSGLPTYTYRLKLGRWVNPTGWAQLHVEQAEYDVLYIGPYGVYSEQIMGGLRSEKSERTFKTVILSDGTIAGYLPTPQTEVDYEGLPEA